MQVKAFALFIALCAAASAQEVTTIEVDEIEIEAVPLAGRTESDLAQPASVVTEEELRRKRAASIGDTLSGELGVNSSSFGLGAGRPIIRGLDGPRIQVLEGGLGSLDVSTISPDHAVTVESLTAEQVEILRGPATLLYGSGASGGAVNVVTNRIPRAIPPNGLTGALELRHQTVNDENTGAIDLTAGRGHFAFHLDGFNRDTHDYEISGRAIEGDPASPRGTLPNSDIDSHGYAGGASFLGEQGYIGLAVSRADSEYGIPAGEMARIDLDQTRYDLDSELLNPFSGFERLRFRLGYNDYEHNEVEPSGEIATTFDNEALEGRVELTHAPIGGWHGVIGTQFLSREFSAIGEEAFLAPTDTRSIALFLVEERKFGRFRLQLGVRGEHTEHEPSETFGNRDFNVYSASAGGIWDFMDGYALGGSFTHAERAPASEELFSNGPHLATAAFEIGDPNLDEEKANNLDLFLRKTQGRFKGAINLFYNRIDDFIFQQTIDGDADGVADLVDEEGGLDPAGELLLLNFVAGDAEFYGAEAEGILSVFANRPDLLTVRLFIDYVRGRLRDGGDLPRITPLRYGLQLRHGGGPWSAGIGVTRVAEQNKVAGFETETDEYTELAADVAYKLRFARAVHTLFLQGRNLLDEEQRNHSSFIKDEAPLPGLSVIFGVRSDF